MNKKVFNKTTFKISIRLLLKTIGCGHFITIVLLFVADIIWIALISPFIHRLQSKMNATIKVKALQHAVKGKISVKDYLNARNKFVEDRLNEK